MPSDVLGPPPPPAATDPPRPWTAWFYGGAPAMERLQDARSVAAKHNAPYPGLGLDTMPMFGGALEYQHSPHLTSRLEGWRTQTKIPVQTGIGRWFEQTLYNVAPSLQGTLPLPVPDTTGYLGLGPVLSQINQRDTSGSSAPDLALGGQLYGGLKYDLNDMIRLMLELKYHRANLTPPDPEGAFHGKYDNLSTLGGVGIRW